MATLKDALTQAIETLRSIRIYDPSLLPIRDRGIRHLQRWLDERCQGLTNNDKWAAERALEELAWRLREKNIHARRNIADVMYLFDSRSTVRLEVEWLPMPGNMHVQINCL